jgi:hypothetical protein
MEPKSKPQPRRPKKANKTKRNPPRNPKNNRTALGNPNVPVPVGLNTQLLQLAHYVGALCHPNEYCGPHVSNNALTGGTVIGYKTFGRSAIEVDSKGSAFVVVNPGIMAGAAGQKDIFQTTAAYVPATAGDINTGAAGIASSFTTPLFGGASNESGRVVAAGLRVWYIGALLSRAGQFYVFHTPNNDSYSSYNYNYYQGDPRTHSVPVSGKKVRWLYYPQDQGDNEWSTTAEITDTTTAMIGGITATGLPSGTQLYYEFVKLVEYRKTDYFNKRTVGTNPLLLHAQAAIQEKLAIGGPVQDVKAHSTSIAKTVASRLELGAEKVGHFVREVLSTAALAAPIAALAA